MKLAMDYAAQYGALHAHHKKFRGYSTNHYTAEIAKLVEQTGARRLLDYGSGKGMQYLDHRIHEQWGGILPYCYDPGYPPLAKRPDGTFDGIICTDVMEHIDPRDVDAVLDDIFGLLTPIQIGHVAPPCFAFFGIATTAAYRKTLPDGRNVHLTVQPGHWWDEKLARYKRDGLVIQARYGG